MLRKTLKYSNSGMWKADERLSVYINFKKFYWKSFEHNFGWQGSSQMSIAFNNTGKSNLNINLTWKGF
jgi:hypothetical protein